MIVPAVVAATQESSAAAPWANAFFFIALFAAVGYFGWNLYQGKKERDDAEAREAEGDSDAPDASGLPEREDVASDDAAGDDAGNDNPRP